MHLNIGAPKYIRKSWGILTHKQHTLIIWDLKTPLLTMDRCFKQKNQQGQSCIKQYFRSNGLVDTYRIFQPKEAKYAFFSNAHKSFPQIDHKVGHQINIKFKKIGIISLIFPGPNEVKRESNLRGKNSKTPKYMGAE